MLRHMTCVTCKQLHFFSFSRGVVLGADMSARSQMKQHLLQHWDIYESLFGASPTCDWPYSVDSCLDTLGMLAITLSKAFMEHASSERNYSLDRKILGTVPSMVGCVRN